MARYLDPAIGTHATWEDSQVSPLDRTRRRARTQLVGPTAHAGRKFCAARRDSPDKVSRIAFHSRSLRADGYAAWRVTVGAIYCRENLSIAPEDGARTVAGMVAIVRRPEF